MRKLIFFMHTSLDGFVAGLKGEMDWIHFNDDMFDFVSMTFRTFGLILIYICLVYEKVVSFLLLFSFSL
mgnify:CR=1 FL=1